MRAHKTLLFLVMVSLVGLAIGCGPETDLTSADAMSGEELEEQLLALDGALASDRAILRPKL